MQKEFHQKFLQIHFRLRKHQAVYYGKSQVRFFLSKKALYIYIVKRRI
jgi:hypothetical protein